jgi:hypothetical protein
MNLEPRLEALEHRLSSNPIALTIPDGCTKEIAGRRLLDMIVELSRGVVREDTQAVIDAVSDDCPSTGNDFMTDVLRAVHAGRVEA